ncbi:lysozyme [Cupriavidus alkaliphilus]|uniref:lysozyme n=1 Tax=Cupriavidus alkaliphilus TaxID=942866 RepID=UPI001620D696|nr:lysozyme [Cupriavidus alkaliphilus]MBB2918349.1 lysozyme [Cupriavidus alkaliphilus]
MKISANGLAVIKYFESCRLSAYFDSGGVPTIGWGHTGPDVRLGMTITQARADELLCADIADHERIVSDAVTVPLTQGQFDALVSFCFNVGPGKKDKKDGLVTLASGKPSTLLRRVNAGDFNAARGQFSLWNKAGGVPQRGLIRRRAAECALFIGMKGADAIAVGRSAA